MKSLKRFVLSFGLIAVSSVAMAQEKSETLKVAGECGMCKKKIESAAKKAGASFASWNAETKELSVKYNSTSSNTAKIEEAIAKAGYDTPTVKATAEAYDKLDECCKYERTSANDAKADHKCGDNKCEEGKCTHGDKCDKDMKCCKSKN